MAVGLAVALTTGYDAVDPVNAVEAAAAPPHIVFVLIPARAASSSTRLEVENLNALIVPGQLQCEH